MLSFRSRPGVRRLRGLLLVQRCLAHKNPPPHTEALCLETWSDPWGGWGSYGRGSSVYHMSRVETKREALCLGTYGDHMGLGVFYERGTPVCKMPRVETKNTALGQDHRPFVEFPD